jgi:importin subunit beta-1
MEVDEALISAQSSDYNTRKNSENFLEKLEIKDTREFFLKLSSVLAKETCEENIRRLAGIVLKNRLEIKEKKNENYFSYKWLNSIDINSREKIKQAVFNVFKSSSNVARRTAAQVTAKITSIELSTGEKNEILSIFTTFLENNKLEINFYRAIIETVEFICQEIGSNNFPEQIFKKYSIQIIKILLISINEIEEIYDEIKIIALNGLISITNYIDEIFKENLYKDFILKSVLNQIKNNNISIRAVSFETLEKIAQNYYHLLDNYMLFFFQLTIQTIEKDNDLVILQAIEFWATIANEEFEMNMDEYQALNEGRFFKPYSQNYILKVSSCLTGLLLNCIKLKNKEEYVEEWNCYNAAGACLNIMSQVSPREVIYSVIWFIDKNIVQKNFQCNVENITLAFIAIFDGIGSKILYTYVRKMLLYWLSNMENNFTEVYDILSLSIGKISHISPCMIRHFLDRIIQSLIINITNRKITYNPCWCLNEILQPFGREGIVDWCFSGIFFIILKKILHNSYDNRITNELFEIISSLIINSSIRNETFVYIILPYLLSNLTTSFSSKNDKIFDIRETQSYLCRIIGCAIQKYGKKINIIFMEKIVDILCQITFELENNSDFFLKEEILSCIGAIVQSNKIKSLFKIKKWIEFLIYCIESTENIEISILAIGVMGDICRTIKKEIYLFIEKIIDVMINKLNQDNTEQKIKPTVITCIGDIALTHALSLKHFNVIIKSFKKIILIQEKLLLEKNSEDLEISLKIRESIFEGVTSVIQGIQNYNQYLNRTSSFENLKWIADFIYDTLCKDRLMIIIKTCVGLIGDLGLSSHRLKCLFKKECWVFQLLNESKFNKDEKIRIIGMWAFDSIYN